MMERNLPSHESPTRYLILPMWIVAVYALGLLMSESATICLWIVCAFFLFALLDPVAEFLKRHRWPTALTAMVLVVVATVVTVGTIYLLGYLLSGVIVELEQSKKLFMHTFDSLIKTYDEWLKKVPFLDPNAPNPNPDVAKVEIVRGAPLGAEMGGTIIHSVGSAATIFTFALLVPILAFFFIAERDGFGRVIARAYRVSDDAHVTWDRIVDSTRAFFVGNLILGIITYPLFVLIFWLFSVPSLFATAALATFFNIIPFAGAVLSGFLPALTLYSQTQAFGGAFAVPFLAAVGFFFFGP